MEKITFKDKKELACYLMDGNVLYTERGHRAYFKDGFFVHYGGGQIEIINDLWDCLTWYKKTEWFEDIPEGGVLCRVWDFNSDIKEFDVITKYRKGNIYKFTSKIDDYTHAEPLTKEEILKFAENAK